jgi:hypothetical protein
MHALYCPPRSQKSVARGCVILCKTCADSPHAWPSPALGRSRQFWPERPVSARPRSAQQFPRRRPPQCPSTGPCSPALYGQGGAAPPSGSWFDDSLETPSSSSSCASRKPALETNLPHPAVHNAAIIGESPSVRPSGRDSGKRSHRYENAFGRSRPQWPVVCPP